MEFSVIGAIVGSIIGGFFAALFNGHFSDRFYGRKRKREIRASVSKALVAFFYALHEQISIVNLVKVLQRQKTLLYDLREKAEDESEKGILTNEITKINDFTNSEIDRNSLLQKEVSESEGNIYGLLMEYRQYNKKINRNEVQNFLKRLQRQRYTSSMTAEIYLGDDYHELLRFKNEELMSLIRTLGNEKLQVMDEMLDEADPLLR